MDESRASARGAKSGSAALVALLLTAGVPADPVAATNFGSATGDTHVTRIYLGDSRLQEYSVWGSGIGDLAYYAIKGIYEPTDLTVSRAANNTEQDVIIVAAPGSGVFWTTCRTDVAAVYGAHHHRVCDKKKITIDTNQWAGWTDAQRKYVIAHEFGHEVGLRHSNTSQSGTNGTGGYVPNTHPNQTATVMYTGGFGSYALHAHDAAHVNVHY